MRPQNLSRCIELRALEHEQRALFWDYRKMPSEFGHLADDAEYEADRARAKRADLLNTIKLEHLVMFHGKSPERYSTSTRELEQVRAVFVELACDDMRRRMLAKRPSGWTESDANDLYTALQNDPEVREAIAAAMIEMLDANEEHNNA